MARAVMCEHGDQVARDLWQGAMIWSAQRLADPKLPPFGGEVLVRHAPTTKLGKLRDRAVPGIVLHRSLRTPGAVCVGVLREGCVEGVADRVTVRAALGPEGDWVFPPVLGVRLGRRRPSARRPAERTDVVADSDAGSIDGMDDLLSANDDVPWGELLRRRRQVRDRDERVVAPEDVRAPDPPAGLREQSEPETSCGRPDVKRARQDGGDNEAEAKRPALGLVTRAIPLKSDEAKKPEAQAAMQKELQNIMAKGVFDPTEV